MITDDDVKKLKTVFATKDDLKNFATKGDLENFARKEDVDGIREDLKRYATKDDLKKVDQKVDRVVETIVQTSQEMRDMEDRLVKQSQEDTNRILEVMDSFTKEIKDHRTEETIHQHQHEEMVGRLDRIEKIPIIAHELRKHAD